MMLVTGERMSWRSGWLRFNALLAVVCAAAGLRAIDPASLWWFPFRTSCGAVSGLPCLFCGMTRASHHLLNGDFARALYLNWLVFPVAAGLILFAVKLTIELILQRRVTLQLPRVRLTRRSLATGLAAAFVLWAVQVSLAVAFHKHELLNPAGPLYSLFVK